MASRSIDFLVVGGGPAGCAFAILAARAGALVLLVERDGYGQLRAGEHLAGRVRPMLDALGVPKHAGNGIALPSPGIHSIWNGNSLVKLYGATGQAGGLCVLRHRFDELLSRSSRDAGADVVSPAWPVEIERLRSRQWKVRITDSRGRDDVVVARSLVDASGRRMRITRAQGAGRISHGDLVAIVRWLDCGRQSWQRAGAMLMVESCRYGWWSLSAASEQTLVATLYTSRTMWRSAQTTAEGWWTQALVTTERIGSIVQDGVLRARATQVYSACPSRASRLAGDGWIAIGDAAVAFDPVAGQGVAMALETAFRAFEAARVDPSWALLGSDYRDALLSRFETHLEGRLRVYEDAAAVFQRSFLHSAVLSRSRVRDAARAAHADIS